ncbi:predicted protein [Streptomyces sp. AA4]|nr:predicted protein [Streptomyces sp. AA4]
MRHASEAVHGFNFASVARGVNKREQNAGTGSLTRRRAFSVQPTFPAAGSRYSLP